MKIIVKENEVGFVIKNGTFIKIVRTGKYHFPKILGYEIYVEEMIGELQYTSLPYDILCKDKNFKSAVVRYTIPDDSIGLIYVNGVLKSFASKKEYIFWDVFEKYEVKIISMATPEISNIVTKQMLSMIPTRYYTKLYVAEGEVGLLYYNNILQRQLTPGLYYYWNYKVEITYRIVDLKRTELEIMGQEILTKDKVGIRMNVTCSYQIVHPHEMTMKIKDIAKQLYSFVQLGIREIVGNYRLDEILELKGKISEELFEKLKKHEEEYYVDISSIGIKDIILPGEIRNIMNTVLVAEKTAQANVITRREEVASTRSLLNTAKLMDENKTLYKLKELEYIERICAEVGELSLSANKGLLEQLSNLVGTR